MSDQPEKPSPSSLASSHADAVELKPSAETSALDLEAEGQKLLDMQRELIGKHKASMNGPFAELADDYAFNVLRLL